MTNDYEMADDNRADLIYEKQNLLAPMLRGNDTGAAPQGRRRHRRRLLPRQHHRTRPAQHTDHGRHEVIAPMTTLLAADAITRTSTGEAVTFWMLGTLALIGALGVVMAANAVYCAMSLAMTMIILAVFYMIEDALFLGVVQIVVYTGAVMMLFLFVLMLIGVDSAESLVETLRGQRVAAVVAGLAFGILLIAGIGNVATPGFAGLTQANAGGNVQGLAALIFSQYLWAFELTSALLITAAIGAMVLAHRERFERRKTQRELSVERFQPGGHPTPLPGPGVFARHNAVDTPARLPDGSPSRLSVPAVLELRPVQDRDLPASHGSNGSGERCVMNPQNYLYLSALLFTIGAAGVLLRRNAIVMFMCVELMLNAVNLAFVTFARMHGHLDGQMVAFFTMVVAACEVVVGLAIIMTIFRARKSASVDDANLLKG